MGRLSKLQLLRSTSRERARDFITNRRLISNVFCPTGEGGGVNPTCSPKGKSSGHGPKSSKDIKTLHDLKVFSSPLTGPDLYTHAVRRSEQLEAIKSEGIKPGKNGKVSTTLSTETPRGQIDSHGVRDTGSGYVVFESRELKNSFKTDKVGNKEDYPEFEFEAVPKSHIVKIVGMVVDKTGHKIREDHLAAFAASHQGIDKKQIQDLPEEYQRWFNLSPTTNAAKKSTSPLQVDPSRTATIQRAFEEQFNRRFKTLQAAILSFAASDFEPTTNAFKFQASEAKLQNFEQWLVSKLSETMEAKDIHRDTDWWQTYIDQAYQQGSSRAYDSATSKGPAKDQKSKDQSFGAKRQFFSTPGSAQLKERLKLVAARTYKGMKGLTDQMKSQLTLALIDGMLKGENPRKLAMRLTETLDISKTRAKMIARTEIIRAHSEGTLATLKALGVTKVGVQVEIAVSGNACPICQKYKKRILTIEEAEGLFPLHPNCKCTPVPHVEDSPSPSKKRQQKRIERSIKSSVKS